MLTCRVSSHIGCKLLICDLACNKIMDQQERVVFSIVPILLLILLLRRARRIRFLLTYNYLDLGTKESAAVSLINRVDGKDTGKEERAGKPGFTLDHRDGLRKCMITGSFEPFGKTISR